MHKKHVWIVGAGGMAVAYAKVLVEMKADITIIGRGTESAARLQDESRLLVKTGGLEKYLATNPPLPDAAIVAVGIEGLASAASQLVEAGVKRVLVEKPGALYFSELQFLSKKATKNCAEVFIAYNRRTYSAVLAAQKAIDEDGGVHSMHFEFTEWGHVIEGLSKAPGVKQAWLLGNSTHVIDLAFFLGGYPTDINALSKGSLSWHPSSAVFVGSGATDRKVLYSYHANWDAPGRWGLEVLTRHRRLIFRPIESLQVMRRGSLVIEAVTIDDRLDKTFKPGLFVQVENFLSGDANLGLCTLDDQIARWPVYEKIAGYSASLR